MSLCWVCLPEQRHALQCAPNSVPLIPSGKVMTDNLYETIPTFGTSCQYINPFAFSSNSNLDVKYLPGYGTMTPVTALHLAPMPDTSKHFHIFVGDLCPYLEPHQLRDAFEPFGQISDCKIIQDPQTMRSKGYGFVTFVKKEDAANAIRTMNSKQVGTRVLRTNWAIRKLSAGVNGKPNTVDEVLQQTSKSNSTVYCGGIMLGLTEDVIRKAFSTYGSIEDIRIFEEKGFAFIRFSSKESAAEAIVGLNLTQINGHVVKCSWGKKGDETGNDSFSSSTLNLHSSSNTQVPPEYCQLISEPQLNQLKQCSARLQMENTAGKYLAYDTVGDCVLQRLANYGSNIVIPGEYSWATLGVQQQMSAVTPTNTPQQLTMSPVFPPGGVLLGHQVQPQVPAPSGNVVYTLHPVI